MVAPGDIITKVIITKYDNINDEGIDGYEVEIHTYSNKKIGYILDIIEELEDSPRGIYDYDGKKYKIIENWDE
jgi:hypothetical protein